MNTTLIGRRAEVSACEFLEDTGMTVVSQNARTRLYELDLVMLDGDTLVIVEVKYRKNALWGGGEAALDRDKIHRLIMATQLWQVEHGYELHAVRIDLVVVEGASLRCRYYPNAVEVSA